ncbi:MAG: hypothetical protein KKA16_06830 [Alphaproteobacteria bacterium]|nr:hypothetical protein [Alphaproteobacteria bacterium]MBU2377763.1 hypothetical protein [Alphaproteobacteria bacterium]
MFFGVSALQTIHVLISLVAIAAGLWVLGGLFASRRMNTATGVFLVTTLVTSLSGFLLPIKGFTPAVGTGIVALVVLVPAFWARYGARMQGRWRGIYVVTAVISLYLNVFVLVAQLFLKVPAVKALAPTGTEPAFLIAQAATLTLFVIAGVLAWKRFRPATAAVQVGPAFA